MQSMVMPGDPAGPSSREAAEALSEIARLRGRTRRSLCRPPTRSRCARHGEIQSAKAAPATVPVLCRRFLPQPPGRKGDMAWPRCDWQRVSSATPATATTRPRRWCCCTGCQRLLHLGTGCPCPGHRRLPGDHVRPARARRQRPHRQLLAGRDAQRPAPAHRWLHIAGQLGLSRRRDASPGGARFLRVPCNLPERQAQALAMSLPPAKSSPRARPQPARKAATGHDATSAESQYSRMATTRDPQMAT
jgi:hypothetical protein